MPHKPRRDPLPVVFDFQPSDDPAIHRDWKLLWDDIARDLRQYLAAENAESSAEPPTEPSAAGAQ